MLVDYGGLQQELSEMREGMVGQLRIGAIPVTLPIIPLLTSPFAQRHRGTDVVVISQTSIEIQRRLEEFNLDVGGVRWHDCRRPCRRRQQAKPTHALIREEEMATVLCVLYDDPVDGYPKSYARDDVPKIERYPGGQTTPTPKQIDFRPGELLGSVSGGLGLRKFLEGLGHTFIVTSDKEGPNSAFERALPDAEIVISQPFWPAYLTAERIAKAKKLKLAITAGIGSDHVDLQAAIEHGVTVAEVTYSNSISVSEHVVMMILSLVRNYIPSYQWVVEGGWNIADCVSRSYDLEGMQVGTVAAGRIGSAVLRRLKPFDVKLHYTDRHRLPESDREGAGRHLSSRTSSRWSASATWSRSTRRCIRRPSTCSTMR